MNNVSELIWKQTKKLEKKDSEEYMEKTEDSKKRDC